ncbi:tektin-2 isoform X1 [Cyprinodon tularosa]|uniref:tektin-2 isoform X1 n=2 Tax=Cyprinodon tularosa TaxID=77115 RepID=UPI0018E23377|nr:tektin-2 isoform X1 [Cyprinodon tularosa]
MREVPKSPLFRSRMSWKPSPRFEVSEWRRNNQQLFDAAQQERHLSQEVRQEGRTLRNETHFKTVLDERDTSGRLSDRIWDVARWRDALERCAQRVDEEMEALTLSKEQSELALAATAVPLEVSHECLTLREGRRGHDLVRDPVEEQLQKEVELIEEVQQRLQKNIDGAFEQLCVLQEVRQKLTSDLQNKMEALNIDMSCLSLTVKSPDISLKTNPTRIPSGSSNPQEWLQFSQYNVAHANEALSASQQMRVDMRLSRSQVRNELDVQRRATEFALRKRIHQEEQAQDELQWQIKKTQEEMAEMENDIRGLDADLQAKTASLKLAHTRLETRTQRSGVDLCRDQVQHSLLAEVQQLEATITALKQKLSEAQHSLQKLKLHHTRMQFDLSRKQEALSLEQRSMNTRTRITSSSGTEEAVVPMVPLMNSSGRSDFELLANSQQLTY